VFKVFVTEAEHRMVIFAIWCSNIGLIDISVLLTETRLVFATLDLTLTPKSYFLSCVGRIRVPPGGHFFTYITLINRRVPPDE
jgi:hypothetical protein